MFDELMTHLNEWLTIICPGPFGKSKNYVISADMKMEDMGKYSKTFGFLGLAFNMMDSKNYDIVYVRLG